MNFTPWFVTRKDNGLVVGEMGYGLDGASGTATLGYSIVEPSWALAMRPTACARCSSTCTATRACA